MKDQANKGDTYGYVVNRSLSGVFGRRWRLGIFSLAPVAAAAVDLPANSPKVSQFRAQGQSGCMLLGGAALGAIGTSAGYEINASSKMDQLEADYKAENLPQRIPSS